MQRANTTRVFSLRTREGTAVGNKLTKEIPLQQPNQSKEMKIADSVLLSLFKGGNEKYNNSHAS